MRDDILVEFDLDENTIAGIKGPPVPIDTFYKKNCRSSEVRMALLDTPCCPIPTFFMWQRNVNPHGVSTWVLWKTIDMHIILRLLPPKEKVWGYLLGYDEDSEVMFLYVNSVYMVHIKSMQSKKLYEIPDTMGNHYSFKSLYTPVR
jgi:hypothetical protein